MKKLILLTVMFVMTLTHAQDNKDKEKLKVSDMSFKQRASIAYFGNFKRTTALQNQDNTLGLTNFILINYKLSEKLIFQITPIFNLVEGRGDEFSEGDTRFALRYTLIENDKLRLKNRVYLTAPLSRESQENGKITQFRYYNEMSYKLNKHNSFVLWSTFTKDFFEKANAPVAETSRHNFWNWLSYANKSFSEKIAARVDYFVFTEHIAGRADNYIKHTSETISIGPDFKLFGISLFPNLEFSVASGSVLALDQANIGLQMFKAF